ncbi:MAG: UDP-N-acetylglucosamine 2-epimerase (non-hydrolyzing), partial [Oxalobacteraceae bacterium]
EGERAAAMARVGRYGVVTLHRPSNVDDPDQLAALMAMLGELSARLPLLFPVHPRTRARLGAMGFIPPPSLQLLPPLPYQAFLSLWSEAALVITDSGGLQEETTALGVPCLTVRENTERPVTVEMGTNRLAGTDADTVLVMAQSLLDEMDRGEGPDGQVPPLWDGAAALRIVGRLSDALI